MIDLTWEVLSSEWSTQHSIRNWQISVDNEQQKELGTPLVSWQPGSQKSNAIPRTDEEVRGDLIGRFKIGQGLRSLSRFWVFNKASRIIKGKKFKTAGTSKMGRNFYYVQQLENGHSGLIPRGFVKIALQNTRDEMARRLLMRKSK